MSYGDDNKWGGCLEIYGDVIIQVLDIKFGCFKIPVDEDKTLTIRPLLNKLHELVQRWHHRHSAMVPKEVEQNHKQKNPLDFLFKNRVEDKKENIEVPDID